MTNEQIKALSDKEFANFARSLPRGLEGRLATGAKWRTDICVRNGVIDSVLVAVQRSETGMLYAMVLPSF